MFVLKARIASLIQVKDSSPRFKGISFACIHTVKPVLIKGFELDSSSSILIDLWTFEVVMKMNYLTLRMEKIIKKQETLFPSVTKGSVYLCEKVIECPQPTP